MKTAFACLCFAGTAAIALGRPEPNAFLNTTAPNMAALIKQVRTDPAVYSRYFKHFGMSKNELVSYFSTLRPATINKAAPYLVYNVREDGIVRSRLFNLQPGSQIYVDVTGAPVMKKICGNPMTKGPKNLKTALLSIPPPVVPPAEVKGEFEEAPQPLTVEEMTPIEELVAPPFEAVPPVTPPVVTPPTITPPTVTPPISVAPPLNLAPLIPLLGGALILGGGGGGGGGVIPEPATISAFVMLTGAFAATRMRRKR